MNFCSFLRLKISQIRNLVSNLQDWPFWTFRVARKFLNWNIHTVILESFMTLNITWKELWGFFQKSKTFLKAACFFFLLFSHQTTSNACKCINASNFDTFLHHRAASLLISLDLSTLEISIKYQMCTPKYAFAQKMQDLKNSSILWICCAFHRVFPYQKSSDGSNTILSNVEQTLTSLFEHRMNSNMLIYWWLNLNTWILASNKRTSNLKGLH